MGGWLRLCCTTETGKNRTRKIKSRRYNETMKFTITLDRDEDGAWVAECPSIPGCVSQGETPEEAENNIREAIVACLEVRAERGMPLTIETRSVEVPMAV